MTPIDEELRRQLERYWRRELPGRISARAGCRFRVVHEPRWAPWEHPMEPHYGSVVPAHINTMHPNWTLREAIATSQRLDDERLHPADDQPPVMRKTAWERLLEDTDE